MTTAEAIAKLKALDLSGFGVRSLELFGSSARGQASESSDLDLLVELEGSVEFMRYAKLWNYLEDTLDVEVDLVLKDCLRPELQPDVEREAVQTDLSLPAAQVAEIVKLEGEEST